LRMRQTPVHRSPPLPSLTPWVRQRPRCFDSRPRGVAFSYIGRWSQFLSECALFRDVTPRDLRLLEEGIRVRSVTRRGFYFEQGASPSAIYILTRGTIKLGRVDREGRQVVLRMVTPPEPFGYDAVFSACSSYSAQALTDSQALMWDSSTFLRIIADHPTIDRNTLRLLASWLRETWERLDDLSARHVAQRVARALLRSIPPAQRRARAELPVTLALSHQDLGEIVGASLYTVSRVLSGWKHLGIVDVKRGRVVIHRADDLAAAAEGGSLRGAMECSRRVTV
jgi:CRP/FNR family transcriptional regulator, nitrogen oxide reductase regulator